MEFVCWPVGEEVLLVLPEHGWVDADELHVAAGGHIVAPLQLLPEVLRGLADGSVHLHTHLAHLLLQALCENTASTGYSGRWQVPVIVADGKYQL